MEELTPKEQFFALVFNFLSVLDKHENIRKEISARKKTAPQQRECIKALEVQEGKIYSNLKGIRAILNEKIKEVDDLYNKYNKHKFWLK